MTLGTATGRVAPAPRIDVDVGPQLQERDGVASADHRVTNCRFETKLYSL